MLVQHALESLIDVVNEHYHTDVKKNFGWEQSNVVTKKKRKKRVHCVSIYGISRNGYYKNQDKQVKEIMKDNMIIEMIQEERRQQPLIGCKKLYHMYRESIHKISPHCERDKFINIMREHDLLVSTKRKYARTTIRTIIFISILTW
jgi:hypothetical protein